MDTREWAQKFVGGWARLSVEDRREAVKELTTPKESGGMGLSQREAADVLGVSEATMNRDLAVTNGTPGPGPEQRAAEALARRPPPTEAEQTAHLRRVWSQQKGALAQVLTHDLAK